MNKTSIAYNRSRRQWELRGEIGEIIATFPSGPAGHRDAQLAQLDIEAPEALHLAQDLETSIPRLAGRAIRAAQLVAQDAVRNTSRPHRWRVRSQSHPRDLYTIHELSNGAPYRWHCNCQDWTNGESGAANGAPWVTHAGKRSPTCKHILAVLIAERIAAHQVTWPPACPDCGKSMVVKRRRIDGSGLPFFSCSSFPLCNGEATWQPHPDDVAAADGDGRQALFLSMERAQAAGLVAVAIGAQRRADQRRVAAYREMVAAGTPAQLAAETVDAGFMPFEEWRQHHRNGRD
jgi:hypothetical protein